MSLEFSFVPAAHFLLALHVNRHTQIEAHPLSQICGATAVETQFLFLARMSLGAAGVVLTAERA